MHTNLRMYADKKWYNIILLPMAAKDQWQQLVPTTPITFHLVCSGLNLFPARLSPMRMMDKA